MSQRIKRSSKNNVNEVTIHTGGHVSRHARGEETVIRVPQKATGDVPAEQLGGLAKASPNFKPIEKVAPKSKEEEQKAIAESVDQTIKTAKKDDKSTPQS